MHVDLAKETIDGDVDSMLFDRVKSIAGLERLAKLKQSRHLQVILSGTPEYISLNNAVELETLTVHECTNICMKSIVRSTNSRNVRIRHFDSPGVNLGGPQRTHSTPIAPLCCRTDGSGVRASTSVSVPSLTCERLDR